MEQLLQQGNADTKSIAADSEGTNIRAMSVATALFFLWRFLTSLNDTLIPHLKSVFDLDYTRAMLVQFAFFFSYFVFAFPAGKVIEWLGYKRTMVVGLVTMTAGALLFIPASRVPSFDLFLAALIVLAAGITVLQVAANPYVANLGPQSTASSLLNLAQAFNSFGTFLAPIARTRNDAFRGQTVPTWVASFSDELNSGNDNTAPSLQSPFLLKCFLNWPETDIVNLPALKT